MPHGSAPSHRVPAFFAKRPAVQLRHSPVLKYVPRGQRTVGKAVGIEVGIDVGASDGWGDGSRVGSKDGDEVGGKAYSRVAISLPLPVPILTLLQYIYQLSARDCANVFASYCSIVSPGCVNCHPRPQLSAQLL